MASAGCGGGPRKALLRPAKRGPSTAPGQAHEQVGTAPCSCHSEAPRCTWRHLQSPGRVATPPRSSKRCAKGLFLTPPASILRVRSNQRCFRPSRIVAR